MGEDERTTAAAVEVIQQRHHEVDRRWRVYDIVKLVLLTLVAILASVTLVVVLLTQDVLRNNSMVNRRSLDTLVGCTTPQHPCYDNQQARTGEAVGQLNEVILAAVHCAHTLPTDVSQDELRKCVEAEVKGATK